MLKEIEMGRGLSLQLSFPLLQLQLQLSWSPRFNFIYAHTEIQLARMYLPQGFFGELKQIRYALKEKKRYYLGIFPKGRTPPPPPLLGTPYPKATSLSILE